jgi:K+-dependent Na+/Ca+ exchanger-like protein
MSRHLDDFPPEALSSDDLAAGGFLLHCVGIIYVFFAVREVCNKYLGPTTAFIVSLFKIQQDIAGATIMAFGNSSPELVICIFSYLIAKTDLGLGTIIGSAAFNSLFLAGFVSLIAKEPLELHWWLLARDFFFNCALMAQLIAYMTGGVFYWWEALLLIGTYCLYCYVMKHNQSIESFCKKQLNIPYDGDPRDYKPLPTTPFQTRRRSITDLEEFLPHKLDFSKGVLAKLVRNSQGYIGDRSENLQDLMQRFKQCVYSILRALEEDKRCSRRLSMRRGLVKPYPQVEEYHSANRPKLYKAQHIEPQPVLVKFEGRRGLASRIKALLMLPFNFMLRMTLPKSPERWLWSLVGSLAWICVLCYLLAWWGHRLADIFGVNDSVIGFLIIAFGVSIPDFLSTIHATLEGSGDLAMSVSLGANNVNIGICLGLSVLISASALDSNPPITDTILWTSVLLISFQVLAFAFIGGFKWKMSRDLGVLLMSFYCLFILGYLLFQFLIF